MGLKGNTHGIFTHEEGIPELVSGERGGVF